MITKLAISKHVNSLQEIEAKFSAQKSAEYKQILYFN
jgi:hypothetical protein